jgi:hypothetical protein
MAKKTKTAKRPKAKSAKSMKVKNLNKIKKATKPMKPKPAKSARRISWVDPKKDTPLIDAYARELDSFMQTMADGKVDDAEIKTQEKRLVKLMKEVEPLLDDRQHEGVTKLLCELTAYDIMQMLYTIQGSRPKSTFQG